MILLISTALIAPGLSPVRQSLHRVVSFDRLEQHEQRSSALAQLCSATAWRPGLWLQCHFGHIVGGLNNARNRLQTCLRLAIDAGAGLVLPPIGLRSQTDLVRTANGSVVCIDQFWDTAWLRQQAAADCPLLQILNCDITQPEADDAWNIRWPNDISRRIRAPIRQWMDHPRHSRGSFGTYLADLLVMHGMEDVSRSHPVVIAFKDTFLGWDYDSSNDSTAIRKDLFRLLRYNAELLAIGTSILEHDQFRSGHIGIHFRSVCGISTLCSDLIALRNLLMQI